MYVKSQAKTWWFNENVVTLHPLFVAPVSESMKKNIITI